MIDPIQQSLADGARALAGASAAARAWVTRIAPTATRVASEKDSLIKATRSAENLARKLDASSRRRNSAGVFGPSQAGKSYLVSVLGRSKGAPFLVDFAGDRKNFIQEINPEGGKEATGLVTRFTIVPGTRDSSHPVELRLLTETDLVKIVGNGFLSDFDQHNRKLDLPDEDVVRQVIAQLEPLANTSSAHLDEITMYDIGEYFAATFSSSIGPLTNGGFWDALTRFGHRLPREARTTLYSLLWGRNADFTAVFTLLMATLEQLGHVATARAAIGSLMPRTRSIIDVDILKHHLGTPEDQQDRIGVVPERTDGGDGPEVQIARATLTALVAEIKVVMADQPWDFFEHTDLLDFPGARSREKNIDLPADPQERAFSVRNIFLRGKIAYLFQRYTEERELTCMLLCMPPSNQDVKDLTSLVAKWVDQTHGGNAQSRAQLPCALFFVLTKFDIELVDKPGDTDDSFRNRIDTRLEASMYQLYKQADWLQNWNGKAFANTFFLRNPGFKLEGVFEYEGDGEERRETGIAAAATERIAKSRQGLVESRRCRMHFTNPELAWDSAMTLNDGGVRYLVDSLERVLSPRLKTQQLAGRLVDQGKALDARLRNFYAAGDEASRKEQEAKLMDLRRRLYMACQPREFKNFAQLQGRLKLTTPEVRAVFLNVASLRLDEPAAPPPAPVAAAVDPWADDPWAAPAAAAPPAQPGGSTTQPMRLLRDRPYHFAAQVLNLWTGHVRSLVADAHALGALGQDARTVGELVDELVAGAHRQQLGERIAERVRRMAAANVRWDEVADRAAGIAAVMVNDYVSYLGFGELPGTQRPDVAKTRTGPLRSGPIFAPPPLPRRGVTPVLPEHPQSLLPDLFMDWGVALLQLGLDNLGSAGGREIGEDDNRQLGQILATMAPALRVSAA